MKTRVIAVCLCLVALVLLLRPYLARKWSAFDTNRMFRGEPVYNGKPLHEWAIQTENGDYVTGGPSAGAIEAARAIQAIGPKAVPWLIKWMESPVSDYRTSGAVYAFKALGSDGKPAIPELAKILNNKDAMDDYSSWHNAAEAISYLGPEAIPAMLTAATNLSGRHIRWELIENLGNMETNGISAIPALIGWTQDKDEWVRLGAVNALGRIGMEPARVIPVLVKALRDADPLVRRDAASALGNYGKEAKDAVPDLIKVLDDADWQTQTGAIEGLGWIGEQREVVIPLIIKKLHSNNGIVRRVSGFALGELGGKEAFDALMQATDDPDGFVREAVFHSLTKIDPNALEKSGKKFY